MVAKMAQRQIFLSAVEEEQCRNRNWELLALERSEAEPLWQLLSSRVVKTLESQQCISTRMTFTALLSPLAAEIF